jgi:hypothetical protein
MFACAGEMRTCVVWSGIRTVDFHEHVVQGVREGVDNIRACRGPGGRAGYASEEEILEGSETGGGDEVVGIAAEAFEEGCDVGGCEMSVYEGVWDLG